MSVSKNKNVLVGPKLNFKIDQRGLGAYIFDKCNTHGNKICQIDAVTGQTETFASVKARSIRVAIEMINSGIKAGDVVSILTDNIMENLIAFTATLFIGAKVASLDPIMTARELKHLVNLVKPKMIFTQESSVDLIEETLSGVQFSPKIVVIGHSKGYKTFDTFLEEKNEANSFRPAIIREIKDETAAIFFTSGSTGLAKGIQLSHFSLLHSPAAMLQSLKQHPRVYFHLSTMYWISAAMITMSCFMTGACRIFTRNEKLEHIADVIQKYKVEFCFFPSYQSHKLVSMVDLENYDFSSLKFFYFGGAAIPAHRVMEVKELTNNVNASLSFGMTECAGFISCFSSEDARTLAAKKPASSGKAIASMTIKIVNPINGKTLGVNEEGEIRIKTPSMMIGYINLDFSDQFDEEGYLRTGDLGYYDEDGCLYVVSRIKEMFTYQSHVILPQAIEAELLEHEAVEDAIVFGLPDEIDENLPAACVIARDSVKITEEELIEFVNNRVSDREKLRGGLRIVKDLPRTPTGKLNRLRFKKMIARFFSQ